MAKKIMDKKKEKIETKSQKKREKNIWSLKLKVSDEKCMHMDIEGKTWNKK